MTMTNASTFMSSQIEGNKIAMEQKEQGKKENKGKKGKKKKKKMSSYKKLLRSIKTSSKTEEQKKEDYRTKISKSLGGGTFNKVQSI